MLKLFTFTIDTHKKIILNKQKIKMFLIKAAKKNYGRVELYAVNGPTATRKRTSTIRIVSPE